MYLRVVVDGNAGRDDPPGNRKSARRTNHVDLVAWRKTALLERSITARTSPDLEGRSIGQLDEADRTVLGNRRPSKVSDYSPWPCTPDESRSGDRFQTTSIVFLEFQPELTTRLQYDNDIASPPLGLHDHADFGEQPRVPGDGTQSHRTFGHVLDRETALCVGHMPRLEAGTIAPPLDLKERPGYRFAFAIPNDPRDRGSLEALLLGGSRRRREEEQPSGCTQRG